MTAPARRPWWKKKRWAAALAAWLLVAYPLGCGPLTYAGVRGWTPPEAALPRLVLHRLADRLPGLKEPVYRYTCWWSIRAYRDHGVAADFGPDGRMRVGWPLPPISN